MKIPYNTFFKQSQQSAPLILFCGPNEPLMRHSIKRLTSQPSFETTVTRTFSNLEPIPWDDVIEELQTFALFSQKTQLIIKLTKANLDKKSMEALIQAMRLVDSNKQLLICCSPLKKKDEKLAWYQYIEKNGLIVTFPELSMNTLAQWLKTKLASEENTLTQDALSLLLSHTEGNLDALLQEVEKLNLSYQKTNIDKSALEGTLLSQGQYTLYQWLDACLNQDIEKSARIFTQLTELNDEKTLLLWGLTKEINTLVNLKHLTDTMNFSQACQALNIWQSKMPLYQKTLRLHDKDSLKLLQKTCYLCDNQLKGIGIGQTLELLEQMSFFLMTKSAHLKTILEAQLGKHYNS